MSATWSEMEFQTLTLGHKRIDKRAVSILDSLGNRPHATIPQSFNTASEIKACYRFFDNDRVTEERLLSPHIESTINRIKEYDTVLIASDTTSLNYTSKPSIKGLGTITHKSNQGIWMHCSLALTPQRLSLGIVHTKLWERKDLKTKLTNHQIYKMPMQEKEANRWIESYKASCEIARKNPKTKIIHMCDREGDFAEFFEEVNEQQKSKNYAEIIVRGAHDRSIRENDDETRMKECLEGKPPLGKISFMIPESGNRKSRNVVQVITSATISFRKRYVGNGESPLVTMNAIMAREESPRTGEEPLCWFFMTSLPISNLEEANQVIEYYLARWEVETFFNVLKNGCKIEEKQLRELGRLKPLIAIYLIVAWRVMYTLMLGRICKDVECTMVFSDYEWQAAWKIANRRVPLPESPPKLGDLVKLIATFGGYLNRKNDKPPGVKVMWIGLQRLRDFSMAWEIYNQQGTSIKSFG